MKGKSRGLLFRLQQVGQAGVEPSLLALQNIENVLVYLLTLNGCHDPKT